MANFGNYVSAAAEEKPLIAAGRGRLMSAYALNVNAAQRYLWLFDATDPNAIAGLTPLAGPFPIAPNGGSAIDISEDEVFQFQNGLVAAASTSGATYTASGSNDFRLTITTMKAF